MTICHAANRFATPVVILPTALAFLVGCTPQIEAVSLSTPQGYSGRVASAYVEPNTERYEEFQDNPVKITAEEPVSTFSVDVDTASYGVMRSYLQDGTLPPKDAIRIEELVNYFDYDYALPENPRQPFKPSIHVYDTPWRADTQLMHIGIKGFDIPQIDQPPLNLVMLLDVSGSMNEPKKLPLLKKTMRLLVNQLGPEDTVSMVVYAGAAGTVLEPTKGSQKEKILNALSKLHAGGSTAGGEGIRRAYELAEANFIEDGVNRVVLATDGDFNVGISDPQRLKGFVERKRESGVFLTVLGFGRGNYHDVMMQKLAQSGNGNAAYIDNLNEAHKVMTDEIAATLFPIAKDVKIQVEFNPAQIAEYRLIGYETRILDRTDFKNDKVDAGDIGSGHTVTALYEVTPVGSPSRLTDPLRYQTEQKKVSTVSNELAYLRIRYKLPDQNTSQLIERPITKADVIPQFDQAAIDIRFAAAVAGLGHLMRGTPYTDDFSFDRVVDIAQAAKGEDPFGYRAEFIQLVRLAEDAEAIPSEGEKPLSRRFLDRF